MLDATNVKRLKALVDLPDYAQIELVPKAKLADDWFTLQFTPPARVLPP
jgi:hypothetical protein